MVYRVGLLGAGIISNRLAQSFEKHADVNMKYVHDINQEKATEFASKYGIIATDLDTILDDPDVDFIYIGVPPKFHAQLAIKSLNAGKHVICEKPIALNQDEVNAMIESRDRNDRITAINLPFRFEPGIARLKEELNNIGDIQLVELRFRYPSWPRAWQQTEWLKTKEQGGALREVGTHYFFALNELFGDVQTEFAQTIYPDEQSSEIRSSAILKLDDALYCNLSLIINSSESDENTLIVYGSEGVLYHRMWHIVSKKVRDNEIQIMAERFSSEYAMLEQFILALKGNEDAKNKLVSFEDAGKAQMILESIHS
ncbi:MAG: Gfo/Idh/MocA family oxidoreductase [Candidatus Heimdallarchaeota archaeon]|nr:Gfo/Idh/MocA family oxidoreductase [Candidatus Heimdallarchaeota archaeon]